MGKLYPPARFEDLEPGDILIHVDELSEYKVHSTHDAVSSDVPFQSIPPQIVTTIIKAEPRSGLCGMQGIVYIMDGRLIHDLRVKQKVKA